MAAPWLLRADEVAPHDARVAYYCRLHAAQEGLRAGGADPALRALLRQLEADKPRAGLQGAAADAAHCTAFATKVFDRADRLVRHRACCCPAHAAARCMLRAARCVLRAARCALRAGMLRAGRCAAAVMRHATNPVSRTARGCTRRTRRRPSTQLRCSWSC
jgi:hypothetical protein